MNAVDCSCVSPKLLVSASDNFKTWDARVKGATGTLEHDFPCTTVVYGMGGNSCIVLGLTIVSLLAGI